MVDYVTSQYADTGLFSEDTPVDSAAPVVEDLSSEPEPSAAFEAFDTEVEDDNTDDVIAVVRESISKNGGSIGSNQNNGASTTSAGSTMALANASSLLAIFVVSLIATIFL